MAYHYLLIQISTNTHFKEIKGEIGLLFLRRTSSFDCSSVSVTSMTLHWYYCLCAWDVTRWLLCWYLFISVHYTHRKICPWIRLYLSLFFLFSLSWLSIFLCVFSGWGRGVITAPLLDLASFPSSQTLACMQEDVPTLGCCVLCVVLCCSCCSLLYCPALSCAVLCCAPSCILWKKKC